MNISPDIIKQAIADQARLPLDRINDDAIIQEIVADSFALVEMMLALQEDFQLALAQEDMIGVKTIADLINLLLSKSEDKA